MVKLINFFHHLFNPHCSHCAEEREELRICNSCETLKIQLEIANSEKKQLLDTILSYTKPTIEERAPTHEIEPIKPKAIPWSIRKNMIEAEDRNKARLMKEQEEIKKLEEELLKEDSRENQNAS